MSNVFAVDAEQARELVQCAIKQRIPAIMSYMSKNKWHVAKVVLVEQSDEAIHLETMHSDRRHQPLNICVGQPVGVSFKHSYAKFVFDTTIQELVPSGSGGKIVIAQPTKMEAIQRRSYFRVGVPSSMPVEVVLWHRTGRQRRADEPHQYYSGRLVDLSAGGAQIALSAQDAVETGDVEAKEFRQRQFIGLRFTPLPCEMPLVINAQIRTVLPTADEDSLCLGLQLVGLEASQEGRETLMRIAQVVEHYHQINEGVLPADAPESWPMHHSDTLRESTVSSQCDSFPSG